MGQEFSHKEVNSKHISYDQYEQDEEKYEEIDKEYMDEDDTNVEPIFDDHSFNEGTRKSRVGVLKLKNFVCHPEGFRPQNNFGIGNCKKKPMPGTRCDCSAMMEINLVVVGLFLIFCDEHNHPFLDPQLTGLLRGHRFMSEADIGHMINMKKSGIRVGQLYQVLANQKGGYEYLSLTQRDMYNKIAKQKR
ncbi:hypothetical protein Ahy_A05g025607 [Arachis hypogaea]|uniref:FAR1 domain-containing protein n=1 Tax=Arachis hypogaea TaxID=3818 RepID=A0A445D941_ARAHY|nr:hypothetical protein Ahy_A05g025607 [Arachis hypogaea]